MSTESIFSSGSSKIQKCLSVINELDETKFGKLLQRISDKAGCQNETIFTLEEIEKLCDAFQLSLDQVKSLVETIEFMFLQCAYHLVKPAKLENDLISLQNFQDEKAQLFVAQWVAQGKQIIERLKNWPIGSHSLFDVRWVLDVGISQSNKTKVKRPSAFYEFQLKNNETKNLESFQIEFNKEELYGFFEKLESIQTQLDALMS